MNANANEQSALSAAGFSFEYPGVWMRFVGEGPDEKLVTVADGRSPNGYQWEVQIEQRGQTIAASEGFASVDDAIAMAAREVQS